MGVVMIPPRDSQLDQAFVETSVIETSVVGASVDSASFVLGIRAVMLAEASGAGMAVAMSAEASGSGMTA